MPYESIRFESAGGIARITLNRPDRLNSFTAAMHAELRDALSAVQADTNARVLLLTGEGRGFCAGQDLSDRAVAPGAAPVDLGESIENNYRPLVLALRNLPLPVVCAVNGVAAGAGANIALACDIVVAAKSASFIQAFCRIGLIPDSGGTWFLPRLVGSARAMGLALTGDKLSAADAAAWGLIWQCVEDGELAPTVEKLLAQLAQAPTRALEFDIPGDPTGPLPQLIDRSGPCGATPSSQQATHLIEGDRILRPEGEQSRPVEASVVIAPL